MTSIRESEDLYNRLLSPSATEDEKRAAWFDLSMKLAALGSRVLSGLDFAAATSAATLTAYRVKHSAGAILLDGQHQILAADDPLDLIGGTPIAPVVDLDGAQAVVLPTAGYSVEIAITALDKGATVGLAAVFGEPTAGATPASPTVDEVRAALLAVGVSGWDRRVGMIVGRVQFVRSGYFAVALDGTWAENDVASIVVNGTAYPVTADSDDDAAALGGKLRAAIGTNEEGVTVGGSGAAVTLTAASGTDLTCTVSKTSTAGTIVATRTDAIAPAIVDPASVQAHAQERAYGSLFARA